MRAGLNVLCGWDVGEVAAFELMGVELTTDPGGWLLWFNGYHVIWSLFVCGMGFSRMFGGCVS